MKPATLRHSFFAATLLVASGINLAQSATQKVTPSAAVGTKVTDSKVTNSDVVFGNWRLTCKPQTNAAGEFCELFQPLINIIGKDPQDPAKNRGQLLATFGIFKLAGNEQAQMLIKAPLGTRLQAPVIKINGHKDVVLPFQFCDTTGCPTVSVLLEQAFLDAVSAAESAESASSKPQGTLVMVLQVTRGDKSSQPEAVNVQFSLNGFGNGLKALLAKGKQAS